MADDRSERPPRHDRDRVAPWKKDVDYGAVFGAEDLTREQLLEQFGIPDMQLEELQERYGPDAEDLNVLADRLLKEHYGPGAAKELDALADQLLEEHFPSGAFGPSVADDEELAAGPLNWPTGAAPI